MGTGGCHAPENLCCAPENLWVVSFHCVSAAPLDRLSFLMPCLRTAPNHEMQMHNGTLSHSICYLVHANFIKCVKCALARAKLCARHCHSNVACHAPPLRLALPTLHHVMPCRRVRDLILAGFLMSPSSAVRSPAILSLQHRAAFPLRNIIWILETLLELFGGRA